MYTNEAWLQTLPAFVRTWQGPVSLIFETTHSRLDSAARSALLASIAKLRDEDRLIKEFVDVHIVGAPQTLSERSLAKTRERMIKNPTARNYQLNLARFFAQTDIVFLVGDARITPSGGLRSKLTTPSAREVLLERGDAIVVPTFGFIRDPTGQPNQLPDFAQLRAQLGIGSEGETVVDDFSGVTSDDFDPLASEYIHTLFETLPLAPEDWPTRKQSLVQLVNTRVPSVASPTTARLALFDKRWDLNHGPSNWYLWRKSSTDPRLQEKPSSGGGLGLGIDGGVGGGREPYRVVDYDLHYSPLVAVSKKGQPWCTERFDDLHAACTYQMYLSGAEMWVLPDEWAYTLEVVERKPEGEKEDPAEKLKVRFLPHRRYHLPSLTPLAPDADLYLIAPVRQVPPGGLHALRPRVPLGRHVGLGQGPAPAQDLRKGESRLDLCTESMLTFCPSQTLGTWGMGSG